MLNYKIEGGNMPVVICYPEAGQTLCTESGSMSWMSPNMKMETTSGGGLGKMAINYGYYNFKFIVMWAAVIGLILLVQIFQTVGAKLAQISDKRLRNRS